MDETRDQQAEHGDADQGARPDEGQINAAALKTMRPEEIVRAHRGGRLNHLLGREPGETWEPAAPPAASENRRARLRRHQFNTDN